MVKNPEDSKDDPTIPVGNTPGRGDLTSLQYLRKIKNKPLNKKSFVGLGDTYKENWGSVTSMLEDYGLDEQTYKRHRHGTYEEEWYNWNIIPKAWLYYADEIAKLAGLRLEAYQKGQIKDGYGDGSVDSNYTALAVLSVLMVVYKLNKEDKNSRSYIQNNKTITVRGENYTLPDTNKLYKTLLELGTPKDLKSQDVIDPDSGGVVFGDKENPMFVLNIQGRKGNTLEDDTGAYLFNGSNCETLSRGLDQAFLKDYIKYRQMNKIKKQLLYLKSEQRKYIKTLLKSKRLKRVYQTIFYPQNHKYF